MISTGDAKELAELFRHACDLLDIVSDAMRDAVKVLDLVDKLRKTLCIGRSRCSCGDRGRYWLAVTARARRR
jgi:hypothetical protein